MNRNHKKHTHSSFTDHTLTAQDVATLFRLKVTTIYALAKSGELPGFKIGSSWRFIESAVQKCIADAKREMKQRPDG